MSGILFSAPMALAVHEGRKTQTRRLASPSYFRLSTYGHGPMERPPKELIPMMLEEAAEFRLLPGGFMSWTAKAAGYQLMDRTNWLAMTVPEVGNLLYVQEPLQKTADGRVLYVSDGTIHPDAEWGWRVNGLAARYMPRWLSRASIKVTDFRVQRLQDITEADCLAEGPMVKGYADFGPAQSLNGVMVETGHEHVYATPRCWYRELWDTLHIEPGERWDDNPWVVALTFEKVI